MLSVEIPHGGSGVGGISRWIQKGTGCLIAADLAESHQLACSSRPMLIGTLVHEYLRLWRSREIEASEFVEFTDNTCGQSIPEEVSEEAYRLFDWYSRNTRRDKFGLVIATELTLDGLAVEAAIGISPYAATIDLLAGTKHACVLVDYKTARASGDTYYRSGAGRPQQVAYYLAAQASGYTITSIKIEQITKTKTPKCNTYDMPIPDVGEIARLKRFLAGAKLRYADGHRTIWLTQCDTCQWYNAGLCTPSNH